MYRRRHASSLERLKDVVNHPEALELFRAHIESEKSSENLAFCLAADAFAKTYVHVSETERHADAHRIWEMYVNPDADIPVSSCNCF